MKKISFFLAIAAVLLIVMGSCKQEDRKLVRYTMSDSASEAEAGLLYELVWEDGMLKELHHSNPSKIERPEFEDFDAVFNYTLEYGYENGVLKSLNGNKYRSELTFEGEKLVRIDQYSKEGGVHAYSMVLDYGEANKVKATYYSMEKDAIQWLECTLYPRNDSTGTRVSMEMPEDTTLHVFAEAEYEYENGNLVCAKLSYVEGLMIESRMEYDNKINPFYGIYCHFDKMDLLAIESAYAFNELGLSKNNLTKVTSRSNVEGVADGQELVIEFSYEYDGEYPMTQKCAQNSGVCHYEYR